MIKVIIGLLAFCLTYQKSLKDVYGNKFLIFFDTILSKYQCGFRKGHGAQHCLKALLAKWRESIDQGQEFVILLTDLSNIFDCLPHYLIIAKLFAYGFGDKHYTLHMTIYSIVSKELRLQTHIVQGKIFYMLFPKNQFWGHCYLMQI